MTYAPKSRKWHFTPEINLGHIFQIGSLVVTIAVFAIRSDRRFTILEMRQDQAAKFIDNLQEQNKISIANQTALVIAQDRLSLLLEGLQKQQKQPL